MKIDIVTIFPDFFRGPLDHGIIRRAQEAGLAAGDVITSLGGTTISTANALTSAISAYHPGDKVSIGWTDGSGQTHTATVQLSSGPPQ